MSNSSKRKSCSDTSIIASLDKMSSLIGENFTYTKLLDQKLNYFNYQIRDGPIVTIYGVQEQFCSDNDPIEWKINGPYGYDITEVEENIIYHLSSCHVSNPDTKKSQIEHIDF